MKPLIDLKTTIGLIFILLFSSACTVITPTPTQPAAPTETPRPVATDTPMPTPTFTAQPTEPPATPTPPSVAGLKTNVEASLMPTPTPNASGWSPASITEVVVLPLIVNDDSQPLRAVSSTGGRYFEAEQYHFVAIYTRDDSGWQELARLELVPNFESDPQDPGADYLFEGSVSQVFVDPSHIWLQVEGGTGAHSGTYHLLSFDGEMLQVEMASFSPSPGVASVADLNDDGVQEVILDASNPYVFCYACGVRKIAFQVFTWDEPNESMFELSIQPMLMGQQGHPAREPNNRAVELAEAGLWKDALTKITEAKEVAAQAKEPTDTFVLDWNYVLIKLHAEAMAEEVAESQYPLLSNIFYGDYDAALNLMRPYGLEELFGPESPLIAGTVAEGWEETLNDWIARSTTLALTARPDLAAAYFLRGWAAYLVNPGNPDALTDIERAIEIAPDEPLFSQIDPEDLKDKTLTEFETKLLGSGYTAVTRKFSQGEISYRASIYTHMEWHANPNYLFIAKTQGDQTAVIYELQEERQMMFVSYTPQGPIDLDWQDMNADGLMELPYRVSQGGNCWACSQMQVLQLRADDSVVNLSDSVPKEDKLGESFVLGAVTDVDYDSVQEWLVYDVRFEFAFNLCHACSPIAHRVYAWDGETYRNASAQFSDYYQGQIDDLTTQVEEMRQSTEPWTGSEVGPMVSLLLTYENAGRGEEGLALFEQYSGPEQYGDRLSEEQLQSLNEAREFFLP